MSREDWLEAVERVLRAKTSDLRELAQIAGCDPRTLYIGANLDGVDLRGQDLRGMVLSDLDPTKVKLDAFTRFDEPVAPERQDLKIPALIYIADKQLDFRRSIIAHGGIIKVHRLAYGDDFLQAAARFHGPTFLIGSTLRPEPLLETSRRLVEQGQDFVVIGLEPRSPPLAAEHRRRFLRRARGPVVLVPQPSEYFVSRPDVSGEALDLLDLLVRAWPQRKRLLHKGGRYFMRAKGVGPEPEKDAAAQLADRLETLNLAAHRATAIRSGTRQEPLPPAADALLRIEDPTDIPWTGRRTFDLGVFVDALSETDDRGYARALQRALAANGWRALISQAVDGQRLSFENEAGGFEAQVVDQIAPTASRAPARLSSTPFQAAERLIICADADLPAVAHLLAERREYWVTARDLVAISAETLSMWPIVAAQLRRVARTPAGRGRHLYLRHLLESAFADDAVHHSQEDFLRALSHDPAMEGRFRMTLQQYRFSDTGTTARLRIADGDGPGTGHVACEADVLVDDAGVQIVEARAPVKPRWLDDPDLARIHRRRPDLFRSHRGQGTDRAVLR